MNDIQRIILNNMSLDAQSAQLGDLLYRGIGNEYYLDPTNGDDDNDGRTLKTAKKTMAAAYALLTANQNDTLYIIGGASSLNVTTGFTWGKAYTHLIGLAAGGPYGRVRFGHNTYVAAITSLFTISVAGCMFKNIHWQQGNGNADQFNCVVLGATAHYNYFENCHFDSPLNAVEGALAYRSLLLTAGVRSTTFRNCWFGDWTAEPTATDGALVEFGGNNAGTQFENCIFIINTSQSSFVALEAAVDLGGGNPAGYAWFRNCDFIVTGTAVSVIFTAPTTGKIVLSNCRAVGATNWSGNSTNVLNASGPACIADGGLGVIIS